MALSFRKMHGLGNDFVVIDGRSGPLALTEASIRAIGDRKTGVGFDQLIVIEPTATPDATAFMRIYNPDGSEAGACGNASRCVAWLLMGESGGDKAVLETVSGLLPANRAGELITVDMGAARLGWQEIPVAAECDTLHMPVSVEGYSDPVGTNMGNPHATFFVPDADAVDLAHVGPLLERHAFFPNRANIGFVSVKDRQHIRFRVWERGAGITRACGSGACAALVASVRRGLVDRKAEVMMDGGPLTIEWRESDGHVLMTGPIATSYTGILAPELVA
ncbi:diaminopimelate epimerase [Lacibacterium aquatile]|uniref:Diaminopimelate epimerase n=1 Tax=Lacibacterium aquatile TaxID=1168082 RepID=A0ABW5DWH5_9PROT